MPRRTEYEVSPEKMEKYRAQAEKERGKISILLYSKLDKKYKRILAPTFHTEAQLARRYPRLPTMNLYDLEKTRFQRLKGFEGNKLVFEDIEGEELEKLEALWERRKK